MTKIIAVIITYNRQDLLKQCLNAVYSQTRPCDDVMIIDNASSDGTQEMLAEVKYKNLRVYILSNNVGAAGGFNAGFRLAYNNGADFVWMMDDDVIPEPDALERLLDADEILRQKGIDHAFVLSTAFTEHGYTTNTPDLSTFKNKIGYEDWPLLLQYGMVPVQRATFVSILVPRVTLEEYGLPIASMFIWGEDTEYTLRITRSAPGFLVGSSQVLHLRQESGPINIFTECNPVRLQYYKHLIRNNIYIARKHRPFYRLIRAFLSYIRLTVRLVIANETYKANIVMKGIYESICYSPADEVVDSPIENLNTSIRLLKLGDNITEEDIAVVPHRVSI